MTLLLFGLNIGEWLTSGAIVAFAGILTMLARKKGIDIKSIFKVAHKVTKELGEAFLSTSNAFEKADQAIKEDGKLKEQSVKDIIDAGKEAIIEWQDVMMVIKPKKK